MIDRPKWHLHLGSALVAGLILVPLAVAAARFYPAPDGPHFSALEPLTRSARHRVEYLLFIPLSTVVVTFFRLTLGVRMFSIFRPVLLAIAFQKVGIPLGMSFLAVALASVVLLQPAAKGRHYYARVSLTAIAVVVLMVAAMIGFQHLRIGWMMRVGYFPVIALCLTCESFASTLSKSGAREALWRTITTSAAGIVILWVSRVPGLMAVLIRCPELLIAQAGCVLLITQKLDFRLLEGWNPLRPASGPLAHSPKIQVAVNDSALETSS